QSPNGATARPETLSVSLVADQVPSSSAPMRTTNFQSFWFLNVMTVALRLFWYRHAYSVGRSGNTICPSRDLNAAEVICGCTMKTQCRSGVTGVDSPSMASGAPSAVLNTMKFICSPERGSPHKGLVAPV